MQDGFLRILFFSLVFTMVILLPGCAARRNAATPLGISDVDGDEIRPALVGIVEQSADAASIPAVNSAHDEYVGANDTPPETAPEKALETVESIEPVSPVVVDPSELAAEALETCESARIFWERGEIDEALTTLDNAYGLLLQLPDGDPDLDQDKEHLRHLISRRVVEISRSRLTSAVELGSQIPIEINRYVEREIKSFQGPERRFFMDSYRRSGMYRPMMVRMMLEAGLPEELSWLPLVESGFKTRALSRARALGMWQFISSTGYRYGLSRDHWIDKRMDPEEATRGAIEYLTELHGMFGDWMTALAGYNCGEHRVMKVIRRQKDDHNDHFWDIFEQLPRETARYVPRFQATLLIVGDPGKYGFELPEPLPAVNFEKVPVERHVKLADLDRALGLAKGTLVAANPALRREVTPDTAYELNVPAAAAPAFQARLDELPQYVPPKDSYTVHRVRRGETLSTIARRYRTTISKIVSANNLRSRNRIRAGQRLKIPYRGATVRTTPVVITGGKAASTTHIVRRGESLWKLASRFGTTVDRIKRDNGLRGDRLTIGQRLRINTGIPEGSLTYAVRRGDTVGKIARSHRVSIHTVLRDNGLSKSSTIYPGQVLVIPN